MKNEKAVPACEINRPMRLAKYRIYLGKPEHRFVYEYFKGEIPQGHVIHHLNGLKGDNRIDNLIAIHKQNHDTKSIVNILKERIRELEGLQQLVT